MLVVSLLASSLSIAAGQARCQSGPNRLQGPSPVPPGLSPTDSDVLAREQFRRRAAEAAQKQLEKLADQLRTRLASEIAARKRAEAQLSELLRRSELTDQIDEQRQRLREDTVAQLRARNKQLEGELNAALWAKKLAEEQLKVINQRRKAR